MTVAAAPRLVMIPGLGADARLFEPQRAAFPDLEVVEWIPPRPREPLSGYALRLAEGVKGDTPPVLVGVSMGGIVALEMARPLGALGMVLVASCRSRRAISRLALPFERAGRMIPDPCLVRLQRFRPGVSLAFGPAGDGELRSLMAMVAGADTGFVRWAGRVLLTWDPPPDLKVPIRHIHGSRDRIMPCRRAAPDRVVAGAGHLVNMTHAQQVNAFIADAARRFAARADTST